uniref:Anaphylatoxin-like domain-containing protein n=1 Tax=Gopherus agassizii TaxID=38772 RepID=A0A452HG06_9SAUR
MVQPLLEEERVLPAHLRKCCQDGMQENPMGYSCDRRAKYVLEGGECVQAFLDCCKHIFDCCKRIVERLPVVHRQFLLGKAPSALGDMGGTSD